ncbi:MAG: YihA family ribosome biogenesis GTP-binding protein, partial [Ruminococcus sp.]|nr:YihA family ribosome biogenesis GTP-binding protein [Ruminococcus sp.]
ADIDMINFLIDADLPMIIVLTKKDKLNKTQQAQQLKMYNELLNGETELFPFSALNGEGTEEIRAAIEKYVEEASESAD